MEKSHLYAWAVREIMSEHSGLPKDDFINLENKTEFMRKKKLEGPKNKPK